MKCVSERGSGRALKLQGVRVALRQNLAAQHGVAQFSCITTNLMGYRHLVDFYLFSLTKRFPITPSAI